MLPAYYEDLKEIKKKIWSMLDDSVTNRSSSFRVPVFVCGDQKDFDGRIVVLRKSDQVNNLLQFAKISLYQPLQIPSHQYRVDRSVKMSLSS